jgi:RNA polymerase sigma factor (sigma-70 family)
MRVQDPVSDEMECHACGFFHCLSLGLAVAFMTVVRDLRAWSETRSGGFVVADFEDGARGEEGFASPPTTPISVGGNDPPVPDLGVAADPPAASPMEGNTAGMAPSTVGTADVPDWFRPVTPAAAYAVILPLAVRHARRRLRCQRSADAIAHDVSAALALAGSFDCPLWWLKGRICYCVRDAVRTHFRREERRRASEICGSDVTNIGRDPVMEEVDANSLRERFEKAAAGLTPRERMVLEFSMQGLDGEQIAAHLRISPGAVRQHLHRAREKLRTTLGPPQG